MEIHLLHEDGEGLRAVLAGAGAVGYHQWTVMVGHWVPVVHVDPVPQQELGLLQEAGRVLELPGLGGVRMEQSLI